MKVVAIAPYNGLKELILQLSKDEEDIDMQVEVGDLTQGVNMAKMAEKMGADIIISRGGTAQLIQKQVSIPVVDIEVSGYDMLRVVTLVSGFKGKVAIVGFPTIAEGAATVCSLLDIDIPTYIIQSEDQVIPKLKELQKENYQVIIGDVITTQKAEKLGFGTVLFTSGKESVLKSFNDARKIYNILMKVKSEQIIPKTIVESIDKGVIVFDRNFKLVYLNSYARNNFECEKLIKREWILDVFEKDEFNSVIDLNNLTFKIIGCKMKQAENEYSVFYISKVFNSCEHKFKGVSVKNKDTYTGLNGTLNLSLESGYMKRENISDKVNSYKDEDSPIWIVGEIGTEKDELAEYIHFGSSMKFSSFIVFDCNIISDFDWQKLFNIEELEDNIFSVMECSSIYLKDINSLSEVGQKFLLKFIKFNEKNKLKFIISSTDDMESRIKKGKFNSNLYYLLSHFTLKIPPLRDRIEELDSLTRLFISEFNTFYGKQIAGIRDEAVLKLKTYKWPGNVSQLKNIIEQLVVSCKGDYIELIDVEQVLQNKSSETSIYTDSIKLNGTLDELEKKIIQTVLEQEEMNQSKAAKRLGISRSTLWRKLK
ncbi:sigma-54-dependent Fis family transcriptional regulator [Clostridium sp. 001]|uniref:sigma-54-dependent Fis family transcriptional regulator n=1 Tax=Clostridium sp. 001 TaxID=1970093 RepID=UPI001C2C8D0C|nr:sigma-54-dependent Fis family transcriptional regulator [Clostridium sp. 001]QXE17868.1 hypothetical protein B5S50_02835 [Clostridium sp. 001]